VRRAATRGRERVPYADGCAGQVNMARERCRLLPPRGDACVLGPAADEPFACAGAALICRWGYPRARGISSSDYFCVLI